MAGSVNKVLIVGRLGQDPQLYHSQAGNPIVSMSVATDESYKNKNGEKVEQTEWHRVVAFGNAAKFCSEYLAKGGLVSVEGSLQTRKWQDQQGNDRYTTEIKAQRIQGLSRAGDSQPNQQNGGSQAKSQAQGDSRPVPPPPPPVEEDAPF